MVDSAERSFRWGQAGNVCVVVHGLRDPATQEWREYVDDMAAHVKVLKGVLVYTAGAGPNSTQRKYLSDMWNRSAITLPVALMTPSTVVRGMVTALNWVMPKPIRTFTPDQVEDALRYLQLNEDEARAALAKLTEFRDALGIGGTEKRRAG
jgi:hypothetical protein